MNPVRRFTHFMPPCWEVTSVLITEWSNCICKILYKPSSKIIPASYLQFQGKEWVNALSQNAFVFRLHNWYNSLSNSVFLRLFYRWRCIFFWSQQSGKVICVSAGRCRIPEQKYMPRNPNSAVVGLVKAKDCLTRPILWPSQGQCQPRRCRSPSFPSRPVSKKSRRHETELFVLSHIYPDWAPQIIWAKDRGWRTYFSWLTHHLTNISCLTHHL